MIEQGLKCPECGTRHDEWDPKLGGDIHAYYPESFLDLGCKVREDAYDAIRENAKSADGKMGNINGMKVRLVPRDVHERRQKALRAARSKGASGTEEETLQFRPLIPFVPFT